MRVLMINSVCGIRSTGRICTDLATALDEEGYEIKIGYGRESVPQQYTKYAVRIGTETDVKLHGLKARVLDADGQGSKRATYQFLQWVDEYNPDVVHLHNIHGYYINFPLLFKYLVNHKKRVIWTLHDMWSFTGHSGTCDAKQCEKWRTGCGNCPLYRGYPASFVDRSARNYLLKKELFAAVKDMTIVTPSEWLANLARQSYLQDKRIVVIPNGIDLTQFRPLGDDFKRHYGVENKVLLMGCSTWWGEGKGLSDFYRLSERLDSKYKIVLVGLDKKQLTELPNGIIGIERTNSVQELAQIYSAADLFLNLTYRDNYPTVNLEALACGTPVITYETGGSSECLDGQNGKSFKKGDVDGLIKFLNEEYKKDMFKIGSLERIDKKTSVKMYVKEIRGGITSM